MASPRRSHIGFLALVLSMTIALGACGTSATDEAAGTAPEASAPDAGALLTRLATEGSDAVFEQRYSGALDAGAEAGPFVFVGRSGGDAVVYVCDGTSGTWFTGTVDQEGSGTLRSADGTASVTLAAEDGGLTTTFDDGTFGGRSATAAQLDDGVGQLIRLQATEAAGGPDAATGGVIITPDGVRGVLTSSSTDGSSNTLIFSETPTSTTSSTARDNQAITDGNSNTINIGEDASTSTTAKGTANNQTITDGNSNTINIGEDASTSTTAKGTGNNQTITDGNSNTINIGETPGTAGDTVVSKTAGGLLTVRVITLSGSTTTTATPASTCAARVAVLRELSRSLASARQRSQDQLDALRRQRDELTAKAKRSTGTDRAALLAQVDSLDRTIAKLQSQIQQITAQIDELTKQIASCQTTTQPSK